MKDFNPIICKNLHHLSGIVKRPERVIALNNILNELDISGFSKLVQRFCEQKNPDQAHDVLLEIWVCHMLRCREGARDLEYEPPNAKRPPDFRLTIDKTTFDVQVKRLLNISNEITKKVFERECRKHLSRIPKAWFINYRVSTQFENRHLNDFFMYVRKNIHNFTFLPVEKALTVNQYYWPGDKKLISFSFHEKNDKSKLGIIPGIIPTGEPGEMRMELIEPEPIRKAVEELLRKSSRTLKSPAGKEQCNLVIVKADPQVWTLDEDMMSEVLCGLLRPDKFYNISGVILVSERTSLLSKKFVGTCFPHPLHQKILEKQPHLFEEMEILNLKAT